MSSYRISLIFTALIVGLGAAFNAFSQQEAPIERLPKAAAAMKEYMEFECKLARHIASSSTIERAKEEARVEGWMKCDCLPLEIDRAVSDLSAGSKDGVVKQNAFVARLNSATETCAARLLRSDTAVRCESDTGGMSATDRKDYCRCLSERMESLDDAVVAGAAAIAHKNLQARVQARAKGQPDPSPDVSVLDDIDKACKKPTR